MLRAVKITAAADNADDTITLESTARYRRRIKMTSDHGIEFLLELPNARLLKDGEAILLADGRAVKVISKPEAVYEVRARDAVHLLRITWQIGNRHLEAQIREDCLYIRRDPVIREMLEGLGATVSEIMAPFDPEGGAYSDHAHGSHGSHTHG